MITFFLSSRRLVVLSLIAIAAILAFLSGHESVSATTPKPDRDITLASNHDRPRGMWGDGTTLWVVENNSTSAGNSLFLPYNLADGSFNEGDDIELASYNSKPQGIWSDGTVVWVADWDDTKLYAYALSDFSRMAGRDINLSRYNDGPRGIWGFGETILVIDKYDTRVYAYSTTDGSRLRDQEFDLHTDNDHPWGIWGQGTRVWISDINDQMLYVYQRSPNNSTHGDRVPALEIRLPSDVDNVMGIWSDGETMWVVDNEANTKIHAMHFIGFRHTADEIDLSDVATPAGLWTDGETMWVADKGRSDHGMLFAYTLSDQTRDSDKDVQLGSFNKDPRSIWSDGETVWVIDDTSGNDYLYAYDLDPDPNEVGQVILHQLIQLHSDNADPVGIWSNGNNIWVSDSGDDKLYTYGLSDKSRKSGRDISLHSQNADPSNIWSDGETIWVLDTNDKHAYAYDLSNGNRKKDREFWTVPDNDDPAGGLTGHALRFWVVDGDDQKLYAYGGRNTPPSFGGATASFEFHRSLVEGDYIGTVPRVEDPDEDEVDYLLTSGTFGVFRLDRQTGELFVKDGAPAFTGGESYTLTVSVSDGRNRLDAVDGDMDDAIDIPVNVITNDNPEFTTADGTVFSVAEDAARGDIVADLEIIDLDDDSLFYEFWVNPASPFQLVKDDVKVSNPEDLNYESTNSYEARIRIRDNKDEAGQWDLSWDDRIKFTIEVTNVDEEGEIIPGSAHPQVGTQMLATLRDPDGVDVSGGNQITWVVRKNVNGSLSNWTEISSTDTTSTDFSYTPVTLDTGTTLQFRATYKDESDGTLDKTVFVNTPNTVLSADPTNKPPVWTEIGTVTRSVAESVAAGSDIGSPVSATDPEDDTLTYLLIEYFHVGNFEIDSGTGQISLKDGKTLDYESAQSYWVRVVVIDGKDRYGNDDSSAEAPNNYDSSKLVAINVTNVEEDGSVQLSTDSPKVDGEITASLREPDGSVSNVVWQWQTADSNPSDTWTDISDATSDAYTPTFSDLGKYLRAKATYDDWDNTGKEAIGTAANAVTRVNNEPPEFNDGATATRSVNENAVAGTRLGAAITALDPEDDTLTYSLAAGSDSDKFVVVSGTGQLEVATGVTFDYETAQDLEFEVVVQVTDSKAADHSQDIAIDDTITVTIELVNVDEPGNVSLSMMEPVVGKSITATLSDDDGGITGANWRWEKSSDGATNWEAINGAESDSYTPATADEGMYLRAIVSYADNEGTDKNAEGVTSGAVEAGTVEEDSGDSEDGGEESGSSRGSSGNVDQNPSPPTFLDICRQDLLAGLLADCVANDFATARVGHDGSYTIDWSEWGEDHPDVTGYTLILQQLLYKTIHENGVEIDTWTLSDVYETCEFTDGAWNCERPIKSNYFEDWAGNPTGVRTVVYNSDQTQWSHSLDSPGRHTATKTFQRWSGDASDPDNEPVPVTYTAMKFEMDVVRFLTHGGSDETSVIGINGANGFD